MIHFGLPAYFGPGAGFAFLGSLLSLISAALAGIVSVLIWPFRMAWLLLVRPKRGRVERVVFLGFEGMDAAGTEALMAQGKLPNLARLREQGSYRRLRTTFPALCPVAWSTFATGVNPAKHGVFDTAPVKEKRGCESFWKILGRYGIRSTILWVPGASQPEHFNGRELKSESVSYPRFYARYLTRLLGSLDRETVFFSALENTRYGVLVCVFDAADIDRITAETLARIDAATAVFVLSDHGSCPAGRCVNLNAWLLREGYLALDATGGIDWTRTRAYAVGSSGVYLNRRLVKLADSAALSKELAQSLAGLIAIQSACLASDLYHGPHLNAAPDIVIGYAAGYGSSPDAIAGKVSPEIFEDCSRSSGGSLGVLFSNLKIAAENPGIEDMAATALNLFGVKTPPWMEGRSVVAVP